MYLCVGTACEWDAFEVLDSPGDGVTRGGEPPYVGAGNQTQAHGETSRTQPLSYLSSFILNNIFSNKKQQNTFKF